MSASDESTGPSQAVVTVAALAAGFVAQKVVSAGWRFIRGTEPGKLDDDSPLPEILVFAAVSAATVAVARNWATHRMRRRAASA
jgi:hypothetical protein